VPSQLRAPHPVIARLRDDEHRLVMPRARRRRSLLILQALAAEAERRGHAVHEEPIPEHQKSRPYTYLGDHYPSRYSRRDGAIRIAIGKFSYAITIEEESPQTADPEKAERLVVEITLYRSQGRQCRWADRKRWKVEDLLGKILGELEKRAVEDTQHEAEEERAKAERRRRWELAIAEARRKAHETHDAAALREQTSHWRESQEINAYCQALAERIHHERPDAPGVREAHEWLSWARAYAASLDPLQILPSRPEHPELQPGDLKPYLHGWSPYGPEEGHRTW
jgi:sRNA-binding protein